MQQTGYQRQGLEFSLSKLYFDHQEEILQKMHFTPPLSIDTHIKSSFQLVEETYFIQGADIETFNSDHKVNDTFMVYKIGILSPKYKNIKMLTIDIGGKSKGATYTAWNEIKSFPIFSWIFFFILLSLIPSVVGSWLIFCNLAAIGIILLYLIYRLLKYFWGLVSKNTLIYKGKRVSYTEKWDLKMLIPQSMEVFSSFGDYNIEYIGVVGNCFYFQQKLEYVPKNIKEFILGLLGNNKVLTEEDKNLLREQTIKKLQDPLFLQTFSEENG